MQTDGQRARDEARRSASARNRHGSLKSCPTCHTATRIGRTSSYYIRFCAGSYEAEVIMPSQKLRILQPTPSTVQYTVSTRPTPDTVSAKVTHCSSLVLRVTLGLGAALLLWAKWRTSYEQQSILLQWTLGAVWEERLLALAQRCPWRYLSPTALALLFLVFKRNYTGTVTPCRTSSHSLD